MLTMCFVAPAGAVVAVACAYDGRSAGPTPAHVVPAQMPARSISSTGSAPSADAVADALDLDPDGTESRSVEDALFPVHLRRVDECRPHRGVSSWVELDELDEAMWKSGQFVARVEQRVAGSFTAPSTREFLYRITVTFCAPSDFVRRVFAVFDAPDAGLAVRGPVRLRFAESTHDDWRFVSVRQAGAAPPRFVIAHRGADGGAVGELAERTLDRPYVAGASFPPSEAPFDCGTVWEAGTSGLEACRSTEAYAREQAAARADQWLNVVPWKVVSP